MSIERTPLHQDLVVIVSAARTPMGGFQGDLQSLSATELGSIAIRAVVERAGIESADVQHVLFGCVLPAGLGQAPARQAALGAGLGNATLCSTVNKMCGSGMQTAIMAHDLLMADSTAVLVAGGMESMSNAPYLLDRARNGYRMGHGKVLDHMFLDGLEDAYEPGRLMGTFAEDCAGSNGFSREAQDAFALASLARAQEAIADGHFDAEIVPVQVTVGKESRQIIHDEQPPKARPDKIPTLKPAFREGGTVTAANSSSISDGAAALLLMRQSEAQRRGLRPLAVFYAHAAFADQPCLFPTAPIGAIQRLLRNRAACGCKLWDFEIGYHSRNGVDTSSAQAYPWRQRPKNVNGRAGQKPRQSRPVSNAPGIPPSCPIPTFPSISILSVMSIFVVAARQR
uniref:acetyl-CoA C-acyltransferase n=2 Tax=Pseudomonas meliae TaxID=86176 RepID=UPI000A8349D1